MRKGTTARTIPGFASNLRKYREIRGLSMAQLGKLLGCTRQHIFQYECGDYSPTFASAINLADALNVSLDELAGRNGA